MAKVVWRLGIQQPRDGPLRACRLAAPERELDIPNDQQVAVVENGFLNPSTVDERAVGAVEVADAVLSVFIDQHNVFTRYSVGTDLQVGRLAAPDDEGELVKGRPFRRTAFLGEVLQPCQTQRAFGHYYGSHKLGPTTKDFEAALMSPAGLVDRLTRTRGFEFAGRAQSLIVTIA